MNHNSSMYMYEIFLVSVYKYSEACLYLNINTETLKRKMKWNLLCVAENIFLNVCKSNFLY